MVAALLCYQFDSNYHTNGDQRKNEEQPTKWMQLNITMIQAAVGMKLKHH